MRKFLSIMLAVMMVLSTVSFAAPSAIGVVETADEFVAVETPAEEAAAELAAYVETTHDIFGTRLFNIDFEEGNKPATLDKATVGGLTNDYAEGWGTLQTTGQLTAVSEAGDSIVATAGYPSFGVKGLPDDGYYTLEADLINSGATFNPTSFSGSAAGNTAGVVAKFVSGNPVSSHQLAGGATNTVAMTVDPAQSGGAAQIYINTMSPGNSGTELSYDNIKLYYKPKTVTLTLVDELGAELATEEVSTLGFSFEELTAIVGLDSPFRGVTSAKLGDNTYATGDTIILAADAEMTVVVEENPTYNQVKGSLLYNMDFEIGEDKEGIALSWQSAATYGIKTYFDPDKVSLTSHTEGGVSKADIVSETVGGEVNRYFSQVGNGDNTFQLYNTKGPYNPIGGRGVYTFQYKVKEYNDTFKARVYNSPGGSAGSLVDMPVSIVAESNGWTTLSCTFDTTDMPNDGPGKIGPFCQTSADYDDIQLWFKPATATITYVTEDGEVSDVLEGVSTTNATLGGIIEEIEKNSALRLYDITGISYAGIDYLLETQASEVIPFPGDAEIELIATKADRDPDAPTTEDVAGIRVPAGEEDEQGGIRFLANVLKDSRDNGSIKAFGWIVTRLELLEDEGLTAEDFNIEYHTFVEGWNYDPEQGVEEKIYDTDAENVWFTAVLYGIPEGHYEDMFVARPVTIVGDEYEYRYGAPVVKSIYEIAEAIYGTEEYNGYETYQQDFIKTVLGITE